MEGETEATSAAEDVDDDDDADDDDGLSVVCDCDVASTSAACTAAESFTCKGTLRPSNTSPFHTVASPSQEKRELAISDVDTGMFNSGSSKEACKEAEEKEDEVEGDRAEDDVVVSLIGRVPLLRMGCGVGTSLLPRRWSTVPTT